MTTINTNIGALLAVQTLQQTQSALDQVQVALDSAVQNDPTDPAVILALSETAAAPSAPPPSPPIAGAQDAVAQAQQVQQLLAVQALNIANQQPDILLSLFR